MSDKPSAKQALLDLYRWATRGPRSGNPYMHEPVKNARRAMGDPRGFDLPSKKPSTAIGKALYNLSEWSTGPGREGNPYGFAVVRAANRALGGDGFNLPGEEPKGTRDVVKSEGQKVGERRYKDARRRLGEKLGREPSTYEMGRDVYRRMLKRKPAGGG